MFKALVFSRSRMVVTISFGVLLSAIVALTLAGLLHIYHVNQRVETIVRDRHARADFVATLLRVSRERSRLVYALGDAPNPAERDLAFGRYRGLAGEFLAAYESLARLEWTPLERTAWGEIARAAAQADALHDKTAALAVAGNRGAAAGMLAASGGDVQAQLQEALQQLAELNGEVTIAAVEQAGLALRKTLLLATAAAMLMLLFGAAVAVAVLRRAYRTEEALHREQERAEVTLHSIGDGVITTDSQGRVEFLNPIAEHYTGWSLNEAKGEPIDAVYRVKDEQTGEPVNHQNRVSGAGAATGMTVQLVHRSGKTCSIRDSYSPIRARSGATVGMVVVFHDVSQIQEMAQRLTWQASHDPLTGLVNRREFERRLGELLETARTQAKQHALMYMDLDNFKAVNDTCGHAAGDELLRQLTIVMSSKVRGSDTLARLGGDEFGMLLEACPVDQALRIANGLREAVRDFRFIWQERSFGVGVSVGLVPIDAKSGDVGRVLAVADTFCYEAKSKGRDRVQVYRPQEGIDEGAHGDLKMLSQINRAFEFGHFRLYRQRIVDLTHADDGAAHYEVLVRMLDREGNLIPPTGFMPAAERYNLLSSIERWVISTLVEFLHHECESGALRQAALAGEVFYAVNLSGTSINDSSFLEFIQKLLTRFDLPRGILCFEVTETTAIANLTKAAELMHELKALGCRFALDDFGIGMSSFAYLKYLPVDVIKIDGVFIRDMAGDPMDYAIVEAINRIGHILGLKTVAEYVEDSATLERLREMGVDYAQGYFIAEPEAIPGREGMQPLQTAIA